MKLYFGKSIKGNECIAFEGETLFVSNPNLIGFLVSLYNAKVKTSEEKISPKDIIINELVVEVIKPKGGGK